MSRSEHLKALSIDLEGYSNSYAEHSAKITMHIDKPGMWEAVDAWIDDCEGFANKSYEIASEIIGLGGIINHLDRSGNVKRRDIGQSGLDEMQAKRASWLARAREQNDRRK